MRGEDPAKIPQDGRLGDAGLDQHVIGERAATIWVLELVWAG
jgi:hypothetical protein